MTGGRLRATWLVLVVATVAFMLPGSASGASFAADPDSLGPIPDGTGGCPGSYGANRDVTFAVAGVGSPIEDVTLSLTLNPAHTWVGDLSVRLIAPGASPSHVIFERTGATPTPGTEQGDDADVAGPYTFSDIGAGPGWWQAAAATPAGSAIPSLFPFNTSAPGPDFDSAIAGFATELTPVFSAATPNGTWTLRFRDICGPSDTGSVSAATLSLEPDAPPPPEPPAPEPTPGETIPSNTIAPDTQAPSVEITKGAPSKIDKSKVRFKFESDDPTALFECKLKGKGVKSKLKQFADCSSPRRYKRLDEGKHKFQVRATDPAGNVGDPARDKFKVV